MKMPMKKGSCEEEVEEMPAKKLPFKKLKKKGKPAAGILAVAMKEKMAKGFPPKK